MRRVARGSVPGQGAEDPCERSGESPTVSSPNDPAPVDPGRTGEGKANGVSRGVLGVGRRGAPWSE